MGDVVIALDVGAARIGLARGEIGSSFAFGRGYLQSRGASADVEAVTEVAREEGASLVVVGLPRHTDGGDTAQTTRVRAFVAALREAGLNVEVEDERFTTRLATSQLQTSGLKRKRRREKGLVDEASAVLILESFLNRVGTPPSRGEA